MSDANLTAARSWPMDDDTGERERRWRRSRWKGDSQMGRPTTYTLARAEKICRRIAEGEPLTKICKDTKMPGYSTALRWRVENSEFRELYARAREDAGDTLADEIIILARRVESGELDPNVGKVVIDAMKWAASKLKPRIYGDRQEVRMAAKLEVEERKPLIEGAPQWIKDYLDETANKDLVDGQWVDRETVSAVAAAASALDKPAAGNA